MDLEGRYGLVWVEEGQVCYVNDNQVIYWNEGYHYGCCVRQNLPHDLVATLFHKKSTVPSKLLVKRKMDFNPQLIPELNVQMGAIKLESSNHKINIQNAYQGDTFEVHVGLVTNNGGCALLKKITPSVWKSLSFDCTIIPFQCLKEGDFYSVSVGSSFHTFTKTSLTIPTAFEMPPIVPNNAISTVSTTTYPIGLIMHFPLSQ